MSYASERLYDGYLRRNMPTIVSNVKVREIIVHLPCLTTHDRENIEAKRETSGNYDGMVLLLDCLKRRENWPEQFIQALEACEHSKLANEIREEYDSLRVVNNSSSSSAPTTVVRAHVHPAPAANRLPDVAASAQPAVTLPAPPEPALQAPPPARQHVPLITAVQSPVAASLPEPQQSPEKEVPLPSTPPPSPELQHAQVTLDQKNFPHQDPEENSESDIRYWSGNTSLVPQKMSSGNDEAAVTVVTSPQQQHVVSHSETETSHGPNPLHTAAAPNNKQQQSLSLTPINSDVSDGSSVLTLTPEKHPVQDTTPPVHKVPTAVVQPERSPEDAAEQIVKSGPAASTPPQPCMNRRDNFPEDGDTMCLSKPGQLISIQVDNPNSQIVQGSSSSMQPYSGNSDRLAISEAASDAETRLPACTSAGPKAENAGPCQENGVAPNHREPEENHYESPNQSFDVMENFGHISEEPSILNLDGQAEVPQKIINGEPTKENKAEDDAELSSNSHQSESYSPPEPEGAGASAEEKPGPNSGLITHQNSMRKYFLIAAGVGACALMALKLKK